MKTQNTPSRRRSHSNLIDTQLAPARALRLALGLTLLACGAPAIAQSDDFDDGNDTGWTRYDREGTATFSFPNGAYRIQASSSPGGSEQDKAQVLSYRSEDYTDFYAAVDLVGWDIQSPTNDVRSAVGLLFRAQNIGPNTTSGYVAYWTPTIFGGGNRLLSIYLIYGDQPLAPAAATYLTLDTSHRYRMTVTGKGQFFEARVYDLADLTQPVAYLPVQDTFLPQLGGGTRGKCGLFAYSRNSTTVEVTFDNYVAAALPPASVPAPGTPHPVAGTPQVVNRTPVSNQNFHPASSGLSFTATTLGGNPIDPADIKLLLNGSDVSSDLAISGTPDSRSVSFSALPSNQAYQARITLKESGGKSSTNDFYFDTFTETFITSSAVKLVECEDYNYGSGQFQNDPLPSGFNSAGNQVNGNGVGYLDLRGEPDVDFHDRRTSAENGYNLYRAEDFVGTFPGTLYFVYVDASQTQVNVTTNDTKLQKFATLDLPDYQVQHTEGGEWLNYTRNFTAGRYLAYLRLSSFSPQDVLLDELSNNGSQTNAMGKFQITNTGHLSTYRYFPLVDDVGNPKALQWSGDKTFRLTMGGEPQDLTRYALQLNYLMFVPAPVSPVTLQNPRWTADTFSVSFSSEPGVTYRLRYKISLTDASWTDVPGSTVGDGTVKSLSDTTTGPLRFYQVSAQ